MNQQEVTKLYIVRHGQSEGNVLDVLQGQKDYPLTELGKQQAQALAEKLKGINFDMVYSSDLIRAHHTAQIITLEQKLDIITSKALREKTLGRFDGQTKAYYKEQMKDILEEIKDLSEEELYKHQAYPDMESTEMVMNRFVAYLKEISLANLGKTVLVVAHGGLIRNFLIKINYCSTKDLPRDRIDNTAYIKVEGNGETFWVRETNGIHFEQVSQIYN